MPSSQAERVRGILALFDKGSTLGDEMPVPKARKYTDGMWVSYGNEVFDENGDQREPTNAELNANFIDRLKVFVGGHFGQPQVKDAAKTAGKAKQDVVTQEVVDDLGGLEEPEPEAVSGKGKK